MYQTVSLPLPFLILSLVLASLAGALLWTWLADLLYRLSARAAARRRQPPSAADATASAWPADDIGRPARRFEDRPGGAP